MGSPANVVEINGQKYNAQTGKPIAKKKPSTTRKKRPTTGVIDGFSAPKKRQPAKAKSAGNVHTKTRKTAKLHPAASKKAVEKPDQKPSVPKPEVEQHRSPKAGLVDANRLARAKTHKKSAKVSKFDSSTKAPAAATTTPAPTTKAQEPAPAAKKEPVVHKKSKIKKVKRKKASSSKQWRSFKKPKARTVIATSVAAIVVFGYLAYLNIPNMAMRVAASKAGFNASLPGYKPSGFGFSGPIAYSQGQITVQYKSHTDDRAFNITERKSSWDSQSLLDNYVVREQEDYLTFHERGLNVYVYDGNNATWVDGGIWYTIEGDASLNTEQILKMASSL